MRGNLLKKCLKKSIGLALAISFAAVPVFAQEAFQGEAKLNAYADEVMVRKQTDFGYPCSLSLQLSDFYRWMLEKNLDTTLINNAGDPFTDHNNINAMSFEREVIEYFGPKYGFTPDNLWGLVTFSGTDGNNHGIYFGAKYLANETGQRPVVYVSKEAHYSNMRLCDLQNLEVCLIDTDERGRMSPEALEKALQPERPALIIYAMGTTFKGAIDDQAALNAVLEKKKPVAVYRHLDAALFGGYLPFTDKKDLVDRNVQPFDSIAVSGHKFLGLDEPAGLFLTTRDVLNKQTGFDVPYLNAEMPMINCSRSALAPLKLWWLIRHDGDKIWNEQATTMLETAAWLGQQLEQIGYPYYVGEASNTVYMKRPPADIVKKYDLAMDYDERLGGELAHVIIMQHVSKEKLQMLIDDLKK